MRGLQDSRWALRDGRSSSVPAPRSRPPHVQPEPAGKGDGTHPEPRPRDLVSAVAELARYSKIVRRMKWKLPFLDLAYQQATSGLAEHSAATREAELMFKLDYFEYYMLCERALVHLQGVHGITIPRGSAQGPRGPSTTDNAGRGRPPTHRYHANVLEALDRKDNPLHPILGTGEVRRRLGQAKDLRNRWKNADDDGQPPKKPSGSLSRNASPPPLASYDLASILACIHDALDHAFSFTRDSIGDAADTANNASVGAVGAVLADTSAMDMDPGAAEAEDWGFMVEAMDWESV